MLYGCETCSLTLREECTLSLFEHRILRPKEDENGEWKRFHNEEFHSLYHSSNIVRVIKYRRQRWTGHIARMKVDRSAFKILSGNPTGKISLGRPRRRWEDNYRMDLKGMGINRGNWVNSA